MLGAECAIGQQRKVGKPKRPVVSAHDASKTPGLKSRPSKKALPGELLCGRASLILMEMSIVPRGL